MAKKCTLYPEYVMFGANPTQHITEYHFIFSSMVVATSCYGYACYWLGSFWGIKINIIKLSTGKIQRKTWFSLLSNRHWEINSPFIRIIT
jgi:hypothetical protein